MVEFADLGEHCFYDLCGQQSFLPFKCDYCQKTYCEHHRTPKSHECKHIPKSKQIVLKKSKNSFKCKVKECKKKSLVLIKCPHCNSAFCVKHRHCDLHECVSVKQQNTEPQDELKDVEITDNRWLFVKSELCKKWNSSIVKSLEIEIGTQEFDFDDLMEDISEYSIDDNNSGLMDFLIEKYDWNQSDKAQLFAKDIRYILQHSPKLDMPDDDDLDDILEDIYSHDDDDKKFENDTKKDGNANIVQWIYNELDGSMDSQLVMPFTQQIVDILMNTHYNDDLARYQLWEKLGVKHANFIDEMMNNRLDIVKKLQLQFQN